MRQLLNIRAVLLATLAAFSTTAPLSAAEDHHTPKFGGVVVETKAGDMEIVAKPESLQIYITDHGKPMKIDGAKAKVTLLNGTEISLDAERKLGRYWRWLRRMKAVGQ